MQGETGTMCGCRKRTCQISPTMCSRRAALPRRPPHSRRSAPAAGQSPAAE